jgi:hypothetical protein
VVTDRSKFNEFLTLSRASWDSEQSTFLSQIWNVFSASKSWWAFVNSAASIFGNLLNSGNAVFASWGFLVNASVSDVVTRNFSGLVTATWLTDIVFVVEKIASIVFDTFVFTVEASGASVSNTAARINRFTQRTTVTVAKWSDSEWASITDTFVLHAAIQSLSFVGYRVQEFTGGTWDFAGFADWNHWSSEDVFAFDVGWAIEWNAFVDGATFSGGSELSSFSDFVTSDVSWARLSLVFALNSTVGVTDTWLANVNNWDWSDWVLNFVVFTVSASAFLVFTAAFVGLGSFTATWFTFLVFTFEFDQTALGSVANARLFVTAFVQSFGFWFVTGGAESVWVVFWMSFVAVDSGTSWFFTSVVFTASSGQVGNSDKFFTLSASVVFGETTALSEGSDVFASGNTVGVTAAWHASVVFLVPLVSDWVFFFVVNTSGHWWNTFFWLGNHIWCSLE